MICHKTKPKSKKTSFHVRPCGFQITRRGKQCKTCQRINYHYTTNHISYFPLYRSHDIHTVNEHLFLTHPCVYIRGWVKNAVFFRAGIINDTGTGIIHQIEDSCLWITSQLLNIVTVSLNSNVPPSNESMYVSLVKFCWMFFEPLHHSYNAYLLNRLSWHQREFKSQGANSGEYGGSSKVVFSNEAIVSLVLTLACGWAVSCRRFNT